MTDHLLAGINNLHQVPVSTQPRIQTKCPCGSVDQYQQSTNEMTRKTNRNFDMLCISTSVSQLC